MEIMSAVGFLLGLSVLLALILAVANQKLKVIEDPRIDIVADMLPNANCGACGLPGCRAFSEHAVAGLIAPSKCTVCAEEVVLEIAEFLGVDAGEAQKRVARLLCRGGTDVAVRAADYEGHSSCRAAAAVTGGFKSCTYGCLGLADCERVCQFDAITMAANELPVVSPEKCTACGDCVDICPKRLFEIMPLERHIVVQCKSQLAGDELKNICTTVCTGCGICASDAPAGMMTMKNNLPQVDPEKFQLETKDIIARCPTRAIVWMDGRQFPELEVKRRQKVRT